MMAALDASEDPDADFDEAGGITLDLLTTAAASREYDFISFACGGADVVAGIIAVREGGFLAAVPAGMVQYLGAKASQSIGSRSGQLP